MSDLATDFARDAAVRSAIDQLIGSDSSSPGRAKALADLFGHVADDKEVLTWCQGYISAKMQASK